MREEEGGCRPLFQGISNVLKNELKLRPCPFCGMDLEYKHSEWLGGKVWAHPKNDYCHLSEMCFQNRQHPIDMWNTRIGESKKCCGNCKHYQEEMCMEGGMKRDPYRVPDNVCGKWKGWWE